MAFDGGLRGTWAVFIRSGVKRGLTSSQTLSAGQAAGLGTYRRTTYLADYREAAQVSMRAPAIKAVRRDYRPGRALYGKGGNRQTRNFRYQISIDVYNPETKYRKRNITNVVSDFEMTPNQVYEEALEPIRQSTEAYQSEIRSYVVEAAFVKEGIEW